MVNRFHKSCVLFGLLISSATAISNPARAADTPESAAPAAAPDEGVVEVEAVGEGTSKEQATKFALRAALEKGGKNEIFSDTKVENFALMHDTIISRAEGIVT